MRRYGSNLNLFETTPGAGADLRKGREAMGRCDV
jgi:hypothetical protein